MTPRITVFVSFLTMALTGITVSAPFTTCHAMTPRPAAFQWTAMRDLPDPIGLKGAYAGVSKGWILLAGGSHFPTPRSQGGSKAYANRIHLRPVQPVDAPWKTLTETLPAGMAEGATVTVDDGIVLLGGQSADGPLNQVTWMSWDPTQKRLQRRELAPLPHAVANCSATFWNGALYVLGGEIDGKSQRNAWRLPSINSSQWEELPPWPGPARYGASVVVLEKNGGESLYLIAGRATSPGPVQQDHYLQDVLCFDLRDQRWTRLNSMPHRTMQAATVKLSTARVAILGGSDGHDLHRITELGERYRIPDHIALYEASTDTWSVAGRMPIGVVGAAVIPLNSGWLIAGGEYSPTLRTAAVNHLSLSTPSSSSSP